MNKREFQRLLTAAIKVAYDDVLAARGDGSHFAAGISSEGFAGGYRAALDDVAAVLGHGCPQDDRRVWQRAKARLANG